MTFDETQLLDWATALGDWLEPHHNHVRPPPAVVLAEASRQTELKTGFPLRGVDLQAHNGDANGHPKKDEEAPPIKEAPGLLTVFFDTMLSRFRHLLESKCSISELLHVATITQEVINGLAAVLVSPANLFPLGVYSFHNRDDALQIFCCGQNSQTW